MKFDFSAMHCSYRCKMPPCVTGKGAQNRFVQHLLKRNSNARFNRILAIGKSMGIYRNEINPLQGIQQ
ncbi:MAG: hypothetical protein OEV15_09965 [Gallionella sp.]|nr:hypothetical protein [Gallionella sp.]